MVNYIGGTDWFSNDFGGPWIGLTRKTVIDCRQTGTGVFRKTPRAFYRKIGFRLLFFERRNTPMGVQFGKNFLTSGTILNFVFAFISA